MVLQNLKQTGDAYLRILSSSQSAEIDVESLADGQDFALRLRAHFE